MSNVNLWELITKVAELDVPNSQECREIKAMIGPSFGTELSLEIQEDGTWVVTVFDHHEPSSNKIILVIQDNGFVTVTRRRVTHGISETRTVSF